MTEHSSGMRIKCLYACVLRICVSLTEKLDEMLSSPKEPVVVMRPRPPEADSRAATVKQRPTSRRITQAEISVSLIHKHNTLCYLYSQHFFP